MTASDPTELRRWLAEPAPCAHRHARRTADGSVECSDCGGRWSPADLADLAETLTIAERVEASS